MAAEPRSTTIKIRSSQGATLSKDIGPLTAGKDYYVFVKNAGGVEVSTNSTMANATVIGGFHTMCCSTTGLDGGHPYYNYAAGQIMPTSVWTRKHSPQDTNGGYVYLANYTGDNSSFTSPNRASTKPWVMIYPGTAYDTNGNPSNVAGSGIVLRSRAIQDSGDGWGSNGWS